LFPGGDPGPHPGPRSGQLNGAALPAEVRRDPTLFGVPLIRFLLGVLLFAALLQARHDLIVLCLLLLGLMTLARMWSRFSLSAARFASVLSQGKAFPGERLRLDLTAENTRLLPLWLQVAWAPEDSLHAHPAEPAPVRHCGLLGYQKVSFRWELAAPPRGVYRLGRPDVRVADPLGFFPREKPSAQEHELVVYPRRVLLRALPIPHRDFFGLPGAESPVQDPIYILGTRDYQHTQPARHIHWNASARHQRLQEKVFEPSHQAKVLLLLDVDSFAREGAAEDFERTLEALGSLALELDRKGCAVGLATDGLTVGGANALLPVARNPLQAPALLEILARLKMQTAEPLLSVLRRGLNLPRGLSCVHFAHRRDGLPHGVRGYFLQRRIPVLEVVAADPDPAPATQESPSPRGRVYRLGDIVAPEAAPP